MLKIVIDNRERSIFGYLQDAKEKYKIDYETKNLTTSDYGILYNNNLIAIIERKTWKDLAASFRDGRINNVNKLLELRKILNCKIFYIIEGNAYPNRANKANNIPYKNLFAHLDHLIFRDDIHIIYSKDIENTVERIFELAYNYSTIKNKSTHLDQPIPDQPIPDQPIPDQPIPDQPIPEQPIPEQPIPDQPIPDHLSLLTIKQESKINYHEQILRTLPGIGSIISSLLVENNITLSKIINDEITISDIANIKYNTGAIIGVKKATKIINIKKILLSSSQNKLQIKLLSEVPLISQKSAKYILMQISIKDIFAYSLEQLKNIKKSDKSIIGQKAAENIYKYILDK